MVSLITKTTLNALRKEYNAQCFKEKIKLATIL